MKAIFLHFVILVTSCTLLAQNQAEPSVPESKKSDIILPTRYNQPIRISYGNNIKSLTVDGHRVSYNPNIRRVRYVRRRLDGTSDQQQVSVDAASTTDNSQQTQTTDSSGGSSSGSTSSTSTDTQVGTNASTSTDDSGQSTQSLTDQIDQAESYLSPQGTSITLDQDQSQFIYNLLEQLRDAAAHYDSDSSSDSSSSNDQSSSSGDECDPQVDQNCALVQVSGSAGDDGTNGAASSQTTSSRRRFVRVHRRKHRSMRNVLSPHQLRRIQNIRRLNKIRAIQRSQGQVFVNNNYAAGHGNHSARLLHRHHHHHRHLNSSRRGLRVRPTHFVRYRRPIVNRWLTNVAPEMQPATDQQTTAASTDISMSPADNVVKQAQPSSPENKEVV